MAFLDCCAVMLLWGRKGNGCCAGGPPHCVFFLLSSHMPASLAETSARIMDVLVPGMGCARFQAQVTLTVSGVQASAFSPHTNSQ
jgi:hypothetical protein